MATPIQYPNWFYSFTQNKTILSLADVSLEILVQIMDNHYKRLKEQKIQAMDNKTSNLEALKKKISNSGGSGSAATAEAPSSNYPNKTVIKNASLHIEVE